MRLAWFPPPRYFGAMAPPIGIVVVEDNRLLREGLTAVLNDQDGIAVLAEADSPTAALESIRQHLPDAVLLDADVDANGARSLVEAIRRIAPDTKVIVTDLRPGELDVIDLIKAGASGFIVKDATIEEFVGTIRKVVAGSSIVPTAMSGTLLSHIADQAARNMPNAAEAVRMTPREREVVVLIAEGLSNKEIATRLSIAGDTVKTHVRNILEKLALHSRLQIAVHAHKSPRSAADQEQVS